MMIILNSDLHSQGLTRPSAANKSFPYHVRTSQVGMMEGDKSGENFEAHSYAPSASAPPTFDIFSVTDVVQVS